MKTRVNPYAPRNNSAAYGSAQANLAARPSQVSETQKTEKKTESVGKRILFALLIVAASTGVGAGCGAGVGPAGIVVGAIIGAVLGIVAAVLRDNAVNCCIDHKSKFDEGSSLLARAEIN